MQPPIKATLSMTKQLHKRWKAKHPFRGIFYLVHGPRLQNVHGFPWHFVGSIVDGKSLHSFEAARLTRSRLPGIALCLLHSRAPSLLCSFSCQHSHCLEKYNCFVMEQFAVEHCLARINPVRVLTVHVRRHRFAPNSFWCTCMTLILSLIIGRYMKPVVVERHCILCGVAQSHLELCVHSSRHTTQPVCLQVLAHKVTHASSATS